MAHITFAWELGGGHGHLRKMGVIADAFRRLGHRVTAVVHDPSIGPAVFGPSAERFLQTPAVLGGLRPDGLADSFADILLQCGYHNPSTLGMTLTAWTDLLRGLAPDLVITEFAPSAQLAARRLGLKRAGLSSGYDLPPIATPFPFMKPWEEPPPGRLEALDAAALASVNLALTAIGDRPLPNLAAIYADTTIFQLTFRELDHYGARDDIDYYGPIYQVGEGVAPRWPGEGQRIFAYANSGHPAFPALLLALRASGRPCALFARGLSAAEADSLSGPTLWVSNRPLHVGQALAEASLVVCQGIGTISAALVAGRPVLVMPEHLEQLMVTARVAGQGLGLGAMWDADEAAVTGLLGRLLDDSGYAARAAGFARHYHGFTPELPAAAVAEECVQILAYNS